MPERRGFSWGAAAIGALTVLLLLAIAAAAILRVGAFPIAATEAYPPGVRTAFETAMHNGVEKRAKGLQPPPVTRAAVLEGGSHYKGMCQQCHGGPGVKPEQFATVMDPDPPELSNAAREWSRSEIFWIAKHGIKMTAMPAFGEIAGDDELWKIAAFVEQMPSVGDEAYAALPDAHAQDQHGSDGHSH